MCVCVYRSKIFLIFIDLRKAYDSVPRAALWCVLRRLGVPSTLVDLVASFHSGMQATVRTSGGATDKIDVNNGLRQGCVMAPVLFNLYFGAVIEAWKSELAKCYPDCGVDVALNASGKLFPRLSSRSFGVVTLGDMGFADHACSLCQLEYMLNTPWMCFVAQLSHLVSSSVPPRPSSWLQVLVSQKKIVTHCLFALRTSHMFQHLSTLAQPSLPMPGLQGMLSAG